MIALLLLVATSLAPQEELALFSDDVTCQSEEQISDLPSCCEEEALLSHLRPEGVQLYNWMDTRGRVRAIDLWKGGKDAQTAVESAAEEMAKRQSAEYPFQKDYQRQIEEKARLKPYTRRFGY